MQANNGDQVNTFECANEEIEKLRSVGRQIAQLGSHLADDEAFARDFLSFAVKADREAMASMFEKSGTSPDAMGQTARPGRELGVKEASYQLRFNVGRFRLLLGVEER